MPFGDWADNDWIDILKGSDDVFEGHYNFWDDVSIKFVCHNDNFAVTDDIIENEDHHIDRFKM